MLRNKHGRCNTALRGVSQCQDAYKVVVSLDVSMALTTYLAKVDTRQE